MTGGSARANLNESPPNYNNWRLIFWRPFLVVTLLNNDRLLVITVHEIHLFIFTSAVTVSADCNNLAVHVERNDSMDICIKKT